MELVMKIGYSLQQRANAQNVILEKSQHWQFTISFQFLQPNNLSTASMILGTYLGQLSYWSIMLQKNLNKFLISIPGCNVQRCALVLNDEIKKLQSICLLSLLLIVFHSQDLKTTSPNWPTCISLLASAENLVLNQTISLALTFFGFNPIVLTLYVLTSLCLFSILVLYIFYMADKENLFHNQELL